MHEDDAIHNVTTANEAFRPTHVFFDNDCITSAVTPLPDRSLDNFDVLNINATSIFRQRGKPIQQTKILKAAAPAGA